MAYPAWTWQWWVAGSVVSALFVGYGVVLATIPSGSNSPQPVIGFGGALLGPSALSAIILWAYFGSAKRIGVGSNGLVVEFPSKRYDVRWDQFESPRLLPTKQGYLFELVWRDSAGKRRTVVADPLTAKYIVDQPSFPKWQLTERFQRELTRHQSDPTTGMKFWTEH